MRAQRPVKRAHKIAAHPKARTKLAPCLPARGKPDEGERCVNGDGVKPGDQVLHRRFEIEFVPHFRAGHTIDKFLIRRPEKYREIRYE